MKLYTVQYFPNKDYEILGMVKGNMVQSKNIGKDILAGLKSLAGGELRQYTEMLNEARDTAVSRMIEEANSLGADAIIGVTFATSSVMEGAAEVMAYGTAVKFND